MRILLSVLVLAAPLPAAAQSFSGPATAIDGDTLTMAGERVRLHGIDAPEAVQTCRRGETDWACGRDASALLTGLVAGRTVECAPRDRDDYGRIVATCRVGARDLAGVMVREGLAIALPRFSLDYVEAEAKAKAFKMALWGSTFAEPAAFRSANPALFRSRPAQAAPRLAPARRTMPAAVWFRNCKEARAAGAAPLYRGRAGYRPEMDGDSDGIACEPYRGRG